MWYLLRRLGVPERDLKDKVHDVFVILHRRWEDRDPARPVRPWLQGMAYKVASEYRRKACNSREIMGRDQQPADHGPGPERAYLQREAREMVHRALHQLEPHQRAVFVFHDIEGRSAPQIARITEAPLNTVYSRLRLARKYFVKAVERLQQAPPPRPPTRSKAAVRRPPGAPEVNDEQSS